MTTSTFPRGRQNKFRVAWESSFGVTPGGNFTELNSYQSEFKPTRSITDDDLLGAGFANTVDDRPAAPSLGDPSFTASVPLDLGQIGWWLALAFGRVTATGSTTKTHVFTTGGVALPTLAMERENVAGSMYEGLLGGAASSLKFNFGPASGYQQVDVAGVGANFLEPYGSTAGGTPTVESLPGRVPKSIGVIKSAGVQIGNVMSGDVTFKNTLTSDRYVGGAGAIGAIALEAVSADITINARYQTDALRALGSYGANLVPPVQSLEVDYTINGNLSLAILLPNVRYQTPSVAVQNGKTLSLTMAGRGELDASNPLATLTLINAHPSY